MYYNYYTTLHFPRCINQMKFHLTDDENGRFHYFYDSKHQISSSNVYNNNNIASWLKTLHYFKVPERNRDNYMIRIQ